MEKVILAGLRLPGIKKEEFENSLLELSRLADTAGAKVEQKIIQNRPKMDPAYLIGSGKAKDIKEIVEKNGIHTVIFENDLKPAQQKNLEELINAKIIDRTRLILDIFAKRARSREGILQVERAQLSYILPRLSEKGIMLDSQAGGIGTRGPGERKLETDQRVIRYKIANLDRQIEKIKERRSVLRQGRIESGQPLIAIVGYTNSGKSTLLNKLSQKHDIYADNKLFATLDPTTRKVKLPGGRFVFFTDTVGFINKLPHTLIAAFASTLEETQKANCLLHIVDVAHPDYKDQIKIVVNVLKELGAEDSPLVCAYNKCDLLPLWKKNKNRKGDSILISAKTGEGIEELLKKIEKIVTPKLFSHRFMLPYRDSKCLSHIYKWAVIKEQKYTEKGINLHIECTPKYWKKISNLLLLKEKN
ncbi:MAG: GTPase HflX [Elusimicrobia bacterium]|nr:GTPase HflX [Elusimicrobiota bacterium]